MNINQTLYYISNLFRYIISFFIFLFIVQYFIIKFQINYTFWRLSTYTYISTSLYVFFAYYLLKNKNNNPLLILFLFWWQPAFSLYFFSNFIIIIHNQEEFISNHASPTTICYILVFICIFFYIFFTNIKPSISTKEHLLNKPIILTVFAKNELTEIQEEINSIQEAVNQNSLITPKLLENATWDSLSNKLSFHRNQIFMFHYGGHTDKSKLILEGLKTVDSTAFSKLLIGDKFMVQIVFLNGCLSVGHVGKLISKRVKVVIATNKNVDDSNASLLAKHFYYQFFIKSSKIKDAFEFAAATVLSNNNSDNRGLLISNKGIENKAYNPQPIVVSPGDDPDGFLAEWTLFIHDEYRDVLDWTLEQFLSAFNKVSTLKKLN